MEIGLNNFGPEAASQLVRAHWALLESLRVSFKFVNDVAIKSLIKGMWPLLRQLLVYTTTSKAHNPVFGWDKQNLQAWQNVEEDCRQMCQDRRQQLESLELPCAKNISAGF